MPSGDYLLLVVQDGANQFQSVGIEITPGVWGVRITDPLAKPILETIRDRLPALTLTARMLAFTPQTGYRMRKDTENASWIFLAETPLASTGATADANGIRIPKRVSVGTEIEENAGFIWNDRATAVGWS